MEKAWCRNRPSRRTIPTQTNTIWLSVSGIRVRNMSLTFIIMQLLIPKERSPTPFSAENMRASSIPLVSASATGFEKRDPIFSLTPLPWSGLIHLD